MNIVGEVVARTGLGTQHASALKNLLPDFLYKMGMQWWIDDDFPRHLFVEICAQCNLSCTFCPREDQRGNMLWEMFTAIIDEATVYGTRSFSLHLFNEPMLSPYWPEAIKYIHHKNRRHRVLLTTNGTTINSRIDDLISANPDLVLWSWRPEAVFTQETKEKLRRWGKFRVRFIEEVTPNEAYLEWADWPNVEGRKLHTYGGNIDIRSFQKDASGATSVDVGSSEVRWPCYHLWLAPAVAWNGNILMCCADPHHKEVLGHFPEDTVASVWQGERLQMIRESHLSGQFTGICQTCDVWKQFPSMHFGFQQRKHVPSH